MRAIISGDLIIGVGSGFTGMTVPASMVTLRPEQMRFDGSEIIDVTSHKEFYIDSDASKHIQQLDVSWQKLMCGWDDELTYSDGFWRVLTDVDRAANSTREAIRLAYVASLAETVNIDGVPWQGNYDDVQKLDGARRLAAEAGLNEVTFYDANNIGHTMAIAEATAIVIQLGSRVQQLIAVKQTAYQQIDNIIADGATSDDEKIAALEAIT